VNGATQRAVAPSLRRAKRLPRSVLERDPVLVAPQLLGKLLRRGALVARIIEVEAYRGATDAASHAFRGRTARNTTMFGPAGHLYVYFTYGMHYCANVVCWPEGEPGAVLLRALAPLSGLEEMAARRYGGREHARAEQRGPEQGSAEPPGLRPRRAEDLCSGPAKLCQAFALDRSADGYDLISGHGGVVLLDDGTQPPDRPSVGTRIGLSKNCAAREEPWRWWVPGEPGVSGPRPGR
jgi:DNA-3-methyladenine glycosylase